MKVSFYNTGKPVINGLYGCNLIGNMVFEVETDSDTERSIFRGLEKNEKNLRIAISEEGHTLSVYQVEEKDKNDR